jgi:hypothetical protein
MSSRRAFTARMITTIVVAGAFATLFFELFGQTLSPLLGALPTLGPKLPPAAIMNQAIAGVTGMDGAQVSALGLGFAGHLAAKMIVYPAVCRRGRARAASDLGRALHTARDPRFMAPNLLTHRYLQRRNAPSLGG